MIILSKNCRCLLLEEQLGVNLFPQLTEEQKRNTYQTTVDGNGKANSAIQYSHWDAEESVCRRFHRAAQSAQKNFKSGSTQSEVVVAPLTKGTGIDAADQKDAIVKQLVDALLQYILQLLR